jgi:cell division protein ZapA (FtsZ GTPase activity inhibitor)
MRSVLLSLLTLYCLAAVEAKTYKLSQSLTGQSLLNAFTWQTG